MVADAKTAAMATGSPPCFLVHAYTSTVLTRARSRQRPRGEASSAGSKQHTPLAGKGTSPEPNPDELAHLPAHAERTARLKRSGNQVLGVEGKRRPSLTIAVSCRIPRRRARSPRRRGPSLASRAHARVRGRGHGRGPGLAWAAASESAAARGSLGEGGGRGGDNAARAESKRDGDGVGWVYMTRWLWLDATDPTRQGHARVSRPGLEAVGRRLGFGWAQRAVTRARVTRKGREEAVWRRLFGPAVFFPWGGLVAFRTF